MEADRLLRAMERRASSSFSRAAGDSPSGAAHEGPPDSYDGPHERSDTTSDVEPSVRGPPAEWAAGCWAPTSGTSSERDLAPHTVTAYLGDISGLLDHATRLGFDGVADLDLRTLRSWLARQQTMGLSRTTLARRATAARVFTGWLARTGRAPTDAGSALGSPKPHRTLPRCCASTRPTS